MDKKLQDLAWSCLPREFKEEVKELYDSAIKMMDIRPSELQVYANKLSTLEYLFGLDNLTSDAEGEEMLYVKAKTVREMYAANDRLIAEFIGSEIAKDAAIINNMLRRLFGSKCLPDEAGNEDNFATKEPKPAEPKFKVGDKVRYVGDMQPTYKGKAFVMDGEVFFNDYYNQWQTRSIKPFAWDGLSVCNVPLTDLEPYTEPEGKLGMDARGWFRSGTAANGNPIKVRIPSGEVDPYTSPAPINFDEIERCDRNYRRLHIAAMAMQGILSNADRMKAYERIATAGPTYEELTAVVARNAMRYADALIRETEKTAKTSN